MARRLSEYMLSRRVVRWGWFSPRRSMVLVVFEDGRAAVVYRDLHYSSVRSWNPLRRAELYREARERFDGTLRELLVEIGWMGGGGDGRGEG